MLWRSPPICVPALDYRQLSENSAPAIQRSSARSTAQARAAARLSIASTPIPRCSRAATKGRGGWTRRLPVPSSRNSGSGSSASRSATSACISAATVAGAAQSRAAIGSISSPPANRISCTLNPAPAKPVITGPGADGSRFSSTTARARDQSRPSRGAMRSAPTGAPSFGTKLCGPTFAQTRIGAAM